MRSVAEGALDDVSEGDQVTLRYTPRETSPLEGNTLVVDATVARTFATIDDEERDTQRVILETPEGSQYQVRWNGAVGWRETTSGRWSDAGTQARIEQRAVADGGQRLIDVCPHCDDTSIYRRNNNPAGGVRQDDHQYHCRNCKQSFDTPDRRPAKSRGDPRPSGNAPLAQKLYDVDKDAVGGDA